MEYRGWIAMCVVVNWTRRTLYLTSTQQRLSVPLVSDAIDSIIVSSARLLTYLLTYLLYVNTACTSHTYGSRSFTVQLQTVSCHRLNRFSRT